VQEQRAGKAPEKGSELQKCEEEAARHGDFKGVSDIGHRLVRFLLALECFRLLFFGNRSNVCRVYLGEKLDNREAA
jgi:hypothetical protein